MAILTHEVQYVADVSRLTRAVSESRKQFQGATAPLDRMAATTDKIADTLEHAAASSVKLGKLGKVGAIGAMFKGAGAGPAANAAASSVAPPGGGSGGASSGFVSGVTGAVTTALIAGAARAGAAFADTVGEVLESADKAGNSRVFDPQAYQRLAAAAKLYDTEIVQVEAAALKLRTELGKAQLNPELQRGLKALGVTAKELKTMRPEEQIGLISDKLGKFQNAGNRAIIAEKVFGTSEARAILPLLEAGSDGLKRAGDEAERLGLVLSDEAVDAAGAAKDALESLGARVDGFKTRLVGALLPTILDITDGLVEAFDTLAAPLATVTGELVGLLMPALETTIQIVSGLGEVAADAIGPLADFWGPILTEVFSGIEDLAFQLIDVFYELAEALGLTGEDSQVMADAGDAVAGALGWLFDQAAMVVDILAEMASIVLDAAGLVWDLVSAVEESTGVFSGLADMITGTVGDSLDHILGLLEDVSELFDLFGNGEWEKGFMKLGNALLDFILEPLRMLVRDIIWVADAISDDLVPDSVRAFADNTREKSAFYEQDADGTEKKSRKQVREESRAERKAAQEQAKKDRAAAAEEKRAEREAQKRKSSEREVSNERVRALEGEGRKLSGPGLVSLGAKDETGREISVWLGKRLDTGKIIGAANRLGLPAPRQALESVALSRQIATAQAPGRPVAPVPVQLAGPVQAPAANGRPPVDMLGAPGVSMRTAATVYQAPPSFTRVVIERLEVNVKGGTDTERLTDFAEQVREIARDEIDRQVRDAEPTINPGGLIG